MNQSGKEAKGWSRGRWALVISSFFLVQLLLIFTERSRRAPLAQEPTTKFHLLSRPVTSTQIARTFFASDPTLFSSASLHSFSGPAWLRIPSVYSDPHYNFPDRDKPTYALSLQVSQLGCLPQLRNVARTVEFEFGELAKPPAYFPFPDTESPLPTRSIVRIEGDLAARHVTVPSSLPPYRWRDVLRRSEVLLAVDQAGIVLSTRLLPEDGRSGSPAADYEALDMARQLHFAPVANSGITRGKLVIEWQTVLPPDNGAALKQEHAN